MKDCSMRFCEIVDSIKSAKEFIEMNRISPAEIIVVWDENVEEKA